MENDDTPLKIVQHSQNVRRRRASTFDVRIMRVFLYRMITRTCAYARVTIYERASTNTGDRSTYRALNERGI